LQRVGRLWRKLIAQSYPQTCPPSLWRIAQITQITKLNYEKYRRGGVNINSPWALFRSIELRRAGTRGHTQTV